MQIILNTQNYLHYLKRINNSSREGINNITILNIGKVTPMYKILKSIKYENII
ncbi:FIG01166383: hypothetical protein [Caloramator australicus RC3]|uniref:Uncharacterized protein n=1 Tax=Caloramator australicus RC3 TaxID=857293 RepID=I7LIB4_9CLOT|nr:FIG01166383: hypothetical protein [Caloramator australicus RC3]